MTSRVAVPLASSSVPRIRNRSRCRPDPHHGRGRFSGRTRIGCEDRARYYSPGLSRFVSEDPLEFGGGDINLYAYVFNAPTTKTDPLGLFTASFCIKLSGGGFGFGAGGGGCFNFGYDKKEGFSTSATGTFGAGGFAGFGLGVGGSFGGSNSPTVFGLTGGSVSLAGGGGAGPIFGAGGWVSTSDPRIRGGEGFGGFGLKVNPALATPFAVEGFVNNTVTFFGYGTRRGFVGPGY